VTPVSFGSCRGWLDLPPVDTVRRDGIVLFGPYGYEDLTARYSLARLAASLSENGHPVLRFDLPGTGDSLDDELDDCPMSAWVDAGLAACAVLRERSGACARILIGFRVGGTVAALVAQALQDRGQTLLGLALLGVAIQGRQYIRELQTLTNHDPELRFAGFPMGAAIQSALNGVDLRAFAQAPAQRIFLAFASESKAQTELVSAWAQDGAVTRVGYPDMARHLGESTTSYLPVALFEQLKQWCAIDIRADGTNPSDKSDSLGVQRLNDRGMLRGSGFVEHAVFIPAKVLLTGVWCESEAMPSPKVVLVLSSSGRNPHIGGARVWVQLARRLAEHGIFSVRFDLAGIGDSPPMAGAPEHLIYHSSGIPQLRSVIDHVAARFPEAKICLIGICSGGFLAFHESISDSRVAGLMIVNLQCYEWRDGTSLEEVADLLGKSTKTYRQLLADPQTWVRLRHGRVNTLYILKMAGRRILSRLKQVVADMQQLVRPPQVVSVNESARPDSCHGPGLVRWGFTGLSNRGTRIVVLYGDTDVGLDQFKRYFGIGGRRFLKLSGAKLSLRSDFDHDLHAEMAQNALHDEVLSLCKDLSNCLD
jgi:alpha-beta hydrolase superfamily lysophospholipase